MLENSELVKSLKSNIRKLRADNEDLVGNQKRYDHVSSELDSAIEKIKFLKDKISTIREVNSESDSLQKEVNRLKIEAADYKKEIERLACERTKLIQLEFENIFKIK